MHQSEGKVFVEEIAQKFAHSEIGPPAMDKQQPLKVSELSKGVITGQDSLHSFLATDANSYVCTCK